MQLPGYHCKVGDKLLCGIFKLIFHHQDLVFLFLRTWNILLYAGCCVMKVELLAMQALNLCKARNYDPRTHLVTDQCRADEKKFPVLLFYCAEF